MIHNQDIMSTDQDYQQFVLKVLDKTGIDLSLYKEAQMKRRLGTLRTKHECTSFITYFDKMLQDEKIFNEFIDRFTINVSEFWRNPKQWYILQDEVIPYLLKNNRPLKIWSAACSTGEEPYTLAIVLSELGVLQESVIHATDIDKTVLSKAEQAVYAKRALREVPQSFINRYFDAIDDSFHVNTLLRSSITFRKHNLLTGIYEKNYDLIICRNVLIYFTETAKNDLYQKFADALRPGGILFVGSTEQIFKPEQYGLQVWSTFFYRKL